MWSSHNKRGNKRRRKKERKRYFICINLLLLILCLKGHTPLRTPCCKHIEPGWLSTNMSTQYKISSRGEGVNAHLTNLRWQSISDSVTVSGSDLWCIEGQCLIKISLQLREKKKNRKKINYPSVNQWQVSIIIGKLWLRKLTRLHNHLILNLQYLVQYLKGLLAIQHHVTDSESIQN